MCASGRSVPRIRTARVIALEPPLRSGRNWPSSRSDQISLSYGRRWQGNYMSTKQFNPKTRSRGIEWTDETRNATGGCLHACEWKMPDGTIAGCYAALIAEKGVAKKA